MQKVYFIAGLSNGENVTEGKGDFAEIEGAPSPWQRLILYTEKNQLVITSLSLATTDGRRWNLPGQGKNPKFAAFSNALKPLSVKMFRKVGMDVNLSNEQSGVKDLYTVIEATYSNNTRLQVWVSELEPHPSWSMTLPVM